ncbi:MAG: aldehyde dehydrogenase family protein [Alphaproteobacteria bacterium]
MTDKKYVLTDEDAKLIADKIAKARTAMHQIADWNQEQVDNLIQSIAWHSSNEDTFTRLAQLGVDESNVGDRAGRPNKRFKIHGVLRDALRQKSVGLVEEDVEKGISKYAKPVGVIASLIPMTNPALTPPVTGVYSAKAKNAVIFTPHPRTKKTTYEMVEVMRKACELVGAPADLFQVIENPSIPLTKELMAKCDLTMATGGKPMVESAYSSGKPAYGVGAGNSTMVIDETADLDIAAENTRISKTSDFGSGCSADGNIIIQQSVYDKMVEALINEGGYLCSEEEKNMIEKAMWDEKGNRTFETIACPPQQTAKEAGFEIPEDRKFLMVNNQGKIGKEYKFCKEKLTTLMSLYSFETFDDALETVRQIYAVAGTGHSCGIYSHSDENIDALAKVAPVSRMMVRQPQSKANAGAWDNGMPMTSSLGCGVWGGNITNENVNLKHYLQYTWVSRPIKTDRPSEEELFGKFYNTETF